MVLQYSNSRLKPLQASCCLDTWPDVVLSSSSLPGQQRKQGLGFLDLLATFPAAETGSLNPQLLRHTPHPIWPPSSLARSHLSLMMRRRAPHDLMISSSAMQQPLHMQIHTRAPRLYLQLAGTISHACVPSVRQPHA